MSQQTDAEPSSGTKNCPSGQKWDADLNKCVEAGGTKPPTKTDAAQNDPFVKKLLIDNIKNLGWEIPAESCDSIASLKQLFLFAKANPKQSTQPPVESGKSTSSNTDSIPAAPAADAASTPSEESLDSLQAKYYNFREDTLLFVPEGKN